MYYYPDQQVPFSGACGYEMRGGELVEESAFSDDYDFDRTFGIVDTCTASAAEEVRRNGCSLVFLFFLKKMN